MSATDPAAAAATAQPEVVEKNEEVDAKENSTEVNTATANVPESSDVTVRKLELKFENSIFQI